MKDVYYPENKQENTLEKVENIKNSEKSKKLSWVRDSGNCM